MNKLMRFNKLSAVQPNSSLREARQILANLQKQVEQSKDIEIMMHYIEGKFMSY